MFWLWGWGDVLTFLMKHENLSFKEVMAEKQTELNIELKDLKKDAKQNDLLDKWYGFLTFLQGKYCHRQLHQNLHAVYTVKSRGLENQDIIQFGLGYAPSPTLQSKWG